MKKEFKVGDFVERTKIFTGENVQQFAELSNDVNPLHLDENFAKKGLFGKRIVHGMLYASMFSELIANKLPGPGSIYLEQNLRFLKPVFWNDMLTARIQIIEIMKHKSLYKLQTRIYKNDTIADLVLDGDALIKFQE